MKILPFALLAGALFLSQPVFAQVASEPPTVPAPAAEPSSGSTALSGTVSVERVPTRKITASELTVEKLKSADGEDLGDIVRVVERAPDHKIYLVVRRGGFLGLFGTEHLVPAERVAVHKDGVVTADMTHSQLERGPTLDPDSYRPVDDSRPVDITQKN